MSKIVPSLTAKKDEVSVDIYVEELANNAYNVCVADSTSKVILAKTDDYGDAMEFLNVFSMPFVVAMYDLETQL
jgi:hypothetical protein